MKDVKINNPGSFEYVDKDGYKHRASFTLFIIRSAWHKGLYLEPYADGFGVGAGTMGGDWSGIRDSSPQAIEKMFEKAVEFLNIEE